MKYPIFFKAAILRKARAQLSQEIIQFDGPLSHGQVLVKVFYSGVCGKQIDEIQEKGGKDNYIPHLLGHEGVGVVIDIGPGAVRHFERHKDNHLHCGMNRAQKLPPFSPTALGYS